MTRRLKYLKIALVTLLLLIEGCSSNSAREATSEVDTEDYAQEDGSADAVETDEIADQDETEMDKGEFTQQGYEKVVGLLNDKYEGYEISISTEIYEASTSIDWMIDDDLQVLYYKESYSIEGTEGSREYYYDSGLMSCYTESESVGDGSETIYYCRDIGGFKIVSSFDSEDSTEPFTFGGLDQKQQMIRQSLDEFVRLLKDSEVTGKGESEYTIDIEEETEYDGIETTNKTRIVISKELYEKIVDDN